MVFYYSTRKLKTGDRFRKSGRWWKLPDFLARAGGLILLLVRNGDAALPEAVAELAPDDLEVGHAAGAGHLSADGLLGPVVPTHASSREPARSAENEKDKLSFK